MPKKKTLKIVAGIAASFAGLAGTIVYLSAAKMVSPGMGILMLVGLVGLYVGFGILIAVYRLISKLD
jgi:xanthosine utilization system XapX-like protein